MLGFSFRSLPQATRPEGKVGLCHGEQCERRGSGWVWGCGARKLVGLRGAEAAWGGGHGAEVTLRCTNSMVGRDFRLR